MSKSPVRNGASAPEAPAVPQRPADGREGADLRERLLRNIPLAMQTIPRWVGAGGKNKKTPISAVTGESKGWREPSKWVTLVEALDFMERNPAVSGVGFMFHEDDDVIGIDLDNAVADPDVDPDDLVPEAADFLENFRSTYAERSMSGNGFHVITVGKWIDGWKKNSGGGKFHVEMYADARHFVMTGDLVDGHPRVITDAPPGELERIQSELMGWDGATAPSSNQKRDPRAGPPMPSAGPKSAPPRERGYFDEVMRRSCARVSMAPERSRNDTLNREAYTLGGIVGGGDLEESPVIEHLAKAARECGLDGQEILPTIISGLRAGMEKPIGADGDHGKRATPSIPRALDDYSPLAMRFQRGDVVEFSDRPDGPGSIGQVLEVNEGSGEVLVEFDSEYEGQRTQDWVVPQFLLNNSRAAPGNRRILRLFTWQEVQDHQPPPPLIEGIIHKGELAVLYGPSGVGKTFASLGMTYSVASGTPWHGRKVQQAAVVYIAGEGALGGIRDRTRAWLISPDEPPTEEGAKDERPTDEQERLSAALDENFFVHRGPVQLFAEAQETSDADALIAAMSALPKPVGLLVIDTMSACVAGANENSARDVGLFLCICDRIRFETGAAVLLIHHTGKAKKLERGSSALRGRCDVMLPLLASGKDMVLQLNDEEAAKARDRGHSPAIVFRKHHVNSVDPTDGVSRVLSLRLRVVKESAAGDGATGDSGAGNNELRARVYQQILQKEIGILPIATRKFLDALPNLRGKYAKVGAHDWYRCKQVAFDKHYVIEEAKGTSRLLRAGPGPSGSTATPTPPEFRIADPTADPHYHSEKEK